MRPQPHRTIEIFLDQPEQAKPPGRNQKVWEGLDGKLNVPGFFKPPAP